jgi:hypothetical protein
MKARIFRQPKTAMQSGTATTHDWVLEFESTGARRADPLMGWSGGSDTQSQIRMIFATHDEAVAFAERQGLAYEVELPRERAFKPKAYADNFKFGRTENWTH